MKRKRWKWVSIGFGAMIISVGTRVYTLTDTGTNIYPNLNKHHAMIRLEDVGPGGAYNSLEKLGELRAVLGYLESQQIPFQVAVIPRMINIDSNGVWQERGIDDPNPDAVVKQFIMLLRDAQQKGGVLGMHGYTHQYGESARPDNSQNSGTGAEFNVPGASSTSETTYAAERITDSLAAFNRTGLQPAFWESPHYKDTRAQERVFRSFIGILYQPDMYSLRSFKDLNMYDTVNTYGQNSLGSVYVPAPLKYVSGSDSVTHMLSKAATYNGLASFYFHPFMDFPFLEPVIGPNGHLVILNGLPLYQYRNGGTNSYLHRLVNGLKRDGYRFMSLYDVVPFTPAQRVVLPLGTKAQDIVLGDVTGEGHADVVVREAHRMIVIPGNYKWPRNRPQAAAEVWLKETFTPAEQLLLADLNGDGHQDLISYNRQTGDLRVAWANGRQFAAPTSIASLPSGLKSLQTFHSDDETGFIAQKDDHIIVIRSVAHRWIASTASTTLPKNSSLYTGHWRSTRQDDILCVSSQGQRVSILHDEGNGRISKPQGLQGIHLHDGQVMLTGDTDGDGLSDLIVYTANTGLWQVYQNEGNDQFHCLDNDFGPWAKGNERVGMIADFDGNAKADIASYDQSQRVLDIATSFRSHTLYERKGY